jgi:hypothetical protein
VLLPSYPVNKCIILYGNMNIREVRTPFLNPVSEQHIRKDKLHCEFRVVMSVTISVKKTMFGSSLPSVVCRRAYVLFTFSCVCLCIVVPNTYYVVFSSSCLPFVVSFSRLSFLIAPSVFSNVYYSTAGNQ